MPIRTNRYYNDPSIGAGFDNIAGMFAPPDGGDAANWATARATQEKAARLADLFANPNDPYFDRRNIAVGNYTPVDSFYAQDQNNSTAMRGQNITAQTSLTNNAADNARALEAERLKATTDFAKTRYGDIAPGALRPDLPGPVAAMFGVPEQTQQRGIVTVGQGETANVPGGEQIMGAPKPRTEAEVKGGILAGLDRATQEALIASGIPLEQVLDPNGNPTFVRRNNAVGKQPVPSADKVETTNYQKPDGSVGLMRIVNGVATDAMTNEPLPAGTTRYTGQLNADSQDKLGGATVANRSAANKIRAQTESGRALAKQLRGLIQSKPGSAGVAADIKSFFQDASQVVNDFSRSFADNPDATVTIDQARALMDRVMPANAPYDPTYRQINMLMFELAYRMAQGLNPSGEVAIKALEMTLKNMGLGLAGNDQSVLATLDSYESMLNRNEQEAMALSNQAPGIPATAPAAGGAEEWERDPATGKLRRKGAP